MESAEKSLVAFDALSNGDSSVWLVEYGKDNEQLILLGGDALIPNWERLFLREYLKTKVFKLPHHGMPNAVNLQILKIFNRIGS